MRWVLFGCINEASAEATARAAVGAILRLRTVHVGTRWQDMDALQKLKHYKQRCGAMVVILEVKILGRASRWNRDQKR
jgi:hypothetical protein